ncbi:MAG: TatD family hydrolase [Thiohalophilus sp.]|uniref:amidohydrolase family protein n=1 Tax=Thiohalophilus sp. TaxID=3028392 RepID=UPI0028702CF8|nr:TatD family hydrolase [Thiohalophilus sp.]MDR9437718.1 TatD family hydrolase [Thiohalophilus sp.]
MLRVALLLLVFPFVSVVNAALPLFDAHLHYNEEDAHEFTPQAIIRILQRNKVTHALVTSRPPQRVQALHEQAPDRIIPFLGVYEQLADKQTWHQDTTLPARVARQLESGTWYGIGELHIFAEHRHSPVLRQLVQLAMQHRLPLLMHADPAIIDTIYDIEPGVRVIWAHAGAYPYPDLLADYLGRYPNLSIDLSVRNERIAPGSELGEQWYELFIRYPDRFLVGVDTFSPNRWREYAAITRTIRGWLAQLPQDVAKQLAYHNARSLLLSSETE